MSYWGGQGWQQPQQQPAYGDCGGGGYSGNGNTFVLIVVLFILLVIVGSVFYSG